MISPLLADIDVYWIGPLEREQLGDLGGDHAVPKVAAEHRRLSAESHGRTDASVGRPPDDETDKLSNA